jgi:hypothetical protein
VSEVKKRRQETERDEKCRVKKVVGEGARIEESVVQ